jgi:transcriptional regulator with XRE-family HTH domain
MSFAMKNTVDAAVGRRVRARRILVGKSQGDLGDLVGVTFQQIQKYESGQNRISASRLLSIAEVLGVPVAHFFDDIDSQPAATNDASILQSDEYIALTRKFHRLSDEQKKTVILMIETMARAGTVDQPVRQVRS